MNQEGGPRGSPLTPSAAPGLSIGVRKRRYPRCNGVFIGCPSGESDIQVKHRSQKGELSPLIKRAADVWPSRDGAEVN
jgi:hypothetical protein